MDDVVQRFPRQTRREHARAATGEGCLRTAATAMGLALVSLRR